MDHPPLIPEITEAVADARGVNPEDLEITLQDSIEMDAIRALADHEDSSWTLAFELPDNTVTITSDGVILVDNVHKEVWA